MATKSKNEGGDKKPAAKKAAPAKKAPGKKAAPVKKATTPAKKAAPAKKAPAKKAPAKKAPAKKAPAKKAAPVKKATTPAKKAPAKKAPAKKAASAKKAPTKKSAPAARTPAKKAPAAEKPTVAVKSVPEKRTPPTKAAERGRLSGIEVNIAVERQKAAQAAGNFELTDLPGELSRPDAAIRIGKNAATDKPLKVVRTLTGITKLYPGQVLVNYGKSEAKWALDFNRRRAGKATFLQLLSYSRQIIGIDSEGRIRICLMGHAGQGISIPLWVVRDEVTLTIQPNDIIMRFDSVEIEE